MLLFNAVEFAQKFQNLPKFAFKIYSFRNFEIRPKINILLFFKKNNLNVKEAPKHVPTTWIFNTTIFYVPLFSPKEQTLYMKLSIALVEDNFFLNVPHLFWV
jgi:hypothetical protein